VTRELTVAAAQLGPVGRHEPRAAVVGRIIDLLHQAKAEGVELAVFPEMALTTFFPRWLIEDEAEVAGFFETEMPGPETRPLFETAAAFGIGFYLGYCEAVEEAGASRRYNSSILVGADGRILGKYRKVHLPGNAVYDPVLKLQHLEPHYFEPGDLGFPVWQAFGGRVGMCICNDRRWPETYRVMGLQGVELILLGYNSPAELPDMPGMDRHRSLHHLLPMQAGAHQNGAWVVASAKAGLEEGCDMMGESCVVAPTGEVVALAATLEDELVVRRINLDATAQAKLFFDFGTYRRPECYGLITERRAAGPPLGEGEA
jgi:predicted amidohydrolase